MFLVVINFYNLINHMDNSWKKFALIDGAILILAVVIILLENFLAARLAAGWISTALSYLSVAAILAFVGSMLWTIANFLIRAFK